MKNWEVIDTGSRTASENMALDAALLESLKNTPRPIVHLYDWAHPAATYGYFLNPSLHLKDNSGLDIARRPTGGGLLFHTADLAFSILLPQGHPGNTQNVFARYTWVNERVSQAIEKIAPLKTSLLTTHPEPKIGEAENFCMAKPTVYDIMVNEKKVAGAAQRRKLWGFLHQGTISIGSLPIQFLTEVLQSEAIARAMQQNTYALLEDGWNQTDLISTRKTLQKGLCDIFLSEE
ncbi:MAG: hypothetical protein JSR80_06945 [Verrucomicrobia bacterium]|nr:hypothetical protein [Verrucomicrobiota bacterium]